jgi:sugar lactone lactonase YvrE
MSSASNATSITGGSAVKRACIILGALALALGFAQAAFAQRPTIKWLTSLYSDTKEVALKFPEGVACTSDHLFVADTGNARLLRYAYSDKILRDETEFPLPKSYPIRIHVNSSGEIFFLDGRERRIGVVSPEGESQGFLEYTGLPSRTEVVPKSFAIDRKDNLYVLDIFSGQVLVLDRNGNYLRHIPFPDEYGFFTDVAIDRKGTIFLLDGVEATVYSADRDADRFSAFTETMKSYMNFPTSLAVDDRGVLYLVDQYGSGLALVGEDGSFLGRKLGLGWKDSGVYYPSQICVSSSGLLFLADRSNSRVQVFSASRNAQRGGEAETAESAD